MNSRRFDALTRALMRVPGSRRQTLATLVGSIAGGLSLKAPGSLEPAAAKKKKHNSRTRSRNRDVEVEGPCGNGKPKRNRCKRDGQCCTDYCKKGRCRCRKLNQSCTEDRNCCPEQRGRVCRAGACVCGDVCASGCQFSSIQEAIDAASAGDTIRLCAETYTGLLNIANDLTLQGTGDGEDGSVLDGQGAGTVVTTPEGSTVALVGLRITGGDVGQQDGGGISNNGHLTLRDCTVTGNRADLVFGGGIYNDTAGTLTLIDSTVASNTAGSDGGGIFNNGKLTLTNSSVLGNSAEAESGAGGGVFNNFGNVTLTDSTVTGNDARSGGGIFNNGTLALDESSVTNNTAGVDGGGIFNGSTLTLDDSSVTNNTAGNDGGGIFNEAVGSITLNSSNVTSNKAGNEGGGVLNAGDLTLDGATNTIAENDPDQCVDRGTGSGCPPLP